MTDPMQQARELLAAESEEYAKWDILNFPIEALRHDLQAALRAIAAALRAAPADLAERHAATERDACRLARIAEEQRDGRLAALERVAELEAKLRAAPEGFVLVPVKPTLEMKEAGEKKASVWQDAWECGEVYKAMLAARPKVGEA